MTWSKNSTSFGALRRYRLAAVRAIRPRIRPFGASNPGSAAISGRHLRRVGWIDRQSTHRLLEVVGQRGVESLAVHFA